jgi:2-polyprenyl-3-methyl-5-hydroxy-6-metoxy-1,4-benzoquinol methylase
LKKNRASQGLYKKATERLFTTPEIKLGPWASYNLVHDPKHLCFVLARYKFCAAMLKNKKRVLEVGCGDGLGLPIIAEAVKHLYVADWDNRLLKGNARRLKHLKNVTYVHSNLNNYSFNTKIDAVFLIDVIEHIDPSNEDYFMRNILHHLDPDGVAILGSPNLTAVNYSSSFSKIQHINLKSMQTLRELMQRYFKNVFMFGMNDEVVHTGYDAMCHHIWAIGTNVKKSIINYPAAIKEYARKR